jgi:hypothetical protein
MPTVAIVDGVRIVFYANEHQPPHFPARIAEMQAVIEIDTLNITHGALPRGKLQKVIEWSRPRQAELRRAFQQASAKQRVEPIE